MRILLVEDDESIIRVLTATLTEQHYIVDVATDGESGWELAETYPYNLVLLDVMLPKLDGISFCQRLRSRRSSVLVMLLTARDTPADKLAGLDSGADDYVVKPFNPQELAARIRALLRRGSTTPSSILTCGGLRLDPETRDVTYNGQALPLSRKEYLLLELFLRSQQQVFSRAAIVDRLWSYGEDPPVEDTVKSHIKSLRRKLGAAGAGDLVETRYGQGYRINPNYLAQAAIAEATVPEPAPPAPAPATPAQNVEAEVARIWEQTKGLTLTQVALLEQTVSALRSSRLDQTAHQSAVQSAHKLAGSLGMFGFESGSQAAQQIEFLLESSWPIPAPADQQALSLKLEPLVGAIVAALSSPDASESQVPPRIDPDRALTEAIGAAQILAVNPNPQIRLNLEELLKPYGLHLTELGEPTQFWFWLKLIQPDLLILNLPPQHSPQMDGLELCRSVRQDLDWQWLPIVLLVDQTDAPTLQQGFTAGADDLVSRANLAAELPLRVLNRLRRSRSLRTHPIAPPA